MNKTHFGFGPANFKPSTKYLHTSQNVTTCLVGKQVFLDETNAKNEISMLKNVGVQILGIVPLVIFSQTSESFKKHTI